MRSMKIIPANYVFKAFYLPCKEYISVDIFIPALQFNSRTISVLFIPAIIRPSILIKILVKRVHKLTNIDY